ncbi:MAG TPA: hypothetical protein VF806_08515 [Anaerolineaceae bacterium]
METNEQVSSQDREEQRPAAATTDKAARGRPFLSHLGALLFFAVLTIAMTWPLVLRMGNAVAGEIGDNIYFIFLIRWYQKAWFELGISPFFHPWLNYPQGWNLASTDTSLATTLFGLPVSLLWGPTFGYNFAMLVTFVFSGWTMYYWVRRLTDNPAAGLVAGTIYAFLPYRMAHFLIGHMNLSGTEWFPLYFMGLYDLLRSLREDARPRDLWKPVVLTAVSLGLIAFTSMHYLLMTVVISAFFVPGYLLLVDGGRLRDGQYWRKLLARFGALGAASLPLVVLAALPFIGLNSQGGLASRTASYASMYSASPTDFFLPSTQHWLLGRWVGAHFDRSLWIEATFYIGAVAFVLAVIAWMRRGSNRHAGLAKVALLVILVAFILSLGTDLHWNNQRVEIPVSGVLRSIVHRSTMPIPMPGYLFFRYVPFYSKMRALMRIGFFALIFTTLLAGFGADWLIKKAGPKWAWPVALLLIILVLLDFYPGPYRQFAMVQARPVDAWLAQQSSKGAVAQFPAAELEDQDQVYNTLIHGKPFIGGFFSANQPEQYLRIRPVLDTFPSPAGATLLRSLGVEWLLFDLRQYADFAPVREQVESLGYRYIDTIGGQAIFAQK